MIKKYPKYKDSEVEWISEIPEGWSLNKLKYLSFIRGSNVDKNIFESERQVMLCNYVDVYKNEKIDSRSNLAHGSCSIEEYEKFHIKKNDVIITKDSETPDDIGIPCLIFEDLENTVCGYHLSLITPDSKKILGPYLFRQFQTERLQQYFEIHANGITRYGLGKSIIENTDIILPHLQEQYQIIFFLDQKASIIDDLIQKKLRKIELLKEQRTSIINKAVTKGLNPDVKMTDSGVELIEEIPVHWSCVFIRHYFNKIGSGVTPRGGSEVYVDSGITFIRSQNVQFDGLHLDDVVKITPETHQIMAGSLVKKGDLLLNITGASIGRCCVVNLDEEMNVNQHVCIVRTKESLSTLFLNYFLQSETGQGQLFFYITGANREGLTGENIKNFKVPLPSVLEQHQIVEYLDEKTSEIDKQVDLENRKIDLLKEYRQSLISEVVTGKIDVRTN